METEVMSFPSDVLFQVNVRFTNETKKSVKMEPLLQISQWLKQI
jgi:hypothetical protein